MAIDVLVYEPDTPADVELYAHGLARDLPDFAVLSTGDRTHALAQAGSARVLIAKAQNVLPELVSAMPNLGLIQALTTGVDPIMALELPSSVTITSGRGIHAPQMAELGLLLMMSLYRRFPQMLDNQRRRVWQRWPQRLLTGRTVTIVGVGLIAEELAARCRAFGMTVIGVTSRASVAGFDEVYPRARLDVALGRADFVVLLVPYSPDTHHLIDERAFCAMREGAYLINIARGGVVDEQALISALQGGRLAGAGLDVFATEPLPESSVLWAMDNVIVTPHIGGMSDRYAEQVLPILVHNSRAYLSGDTASLQNCVRHGARS